MVIVHLFVSLFLFLLLSVGGWLRLVLVALPGLFRLPFFLAINLRLYLFDFSVFEQKDYRK